MVELIVDRQHLFCHFNIGLAEILSWNRGVRMGEGSSVDMLGSTEATALPGGGERLGLSPASSTPESP